MSTMKSKRKKIVYSDDDYTDSEHTVSHMEDSDCEVGSRSCEENDNNDIDTEQDGTITNKPKSIFTNLFNLARELLIEAYHAEETADEQNRRRNKFVMFYDQYVTVVGKVSKKTWYMNYSTGFIAPPTVEYVIKVKPNMHEHEAWQSLFVVKKSTLGTNSQGEMIDGKLYRESGYGLFAARDFEKDEYIGPYLGDVIERTFDKYGEETTFTSSYSLDLGKDVLIDPGGGQWSHWYFGLQMINDARDDRRQNVRVDTDLRFYANRNIRRGEELFFSYGSGFWQVVGRN